MLAALAVSAVNLGLYLAFYTAYSKATKALDSALLWDVLYVRKSLDFTLVELNKVISLTGLTNVRPLACDSLTFRSSFWPS